MPHCRRPASAADVTVQARRLCNVIFVLQVLVPTRELAGDHYSEHRGQHYFEKLVNFMSSGAAALTEHAPPCLAVLNVNGEFIHASLLQTGAVVAMVWEGEQIISTARNMLGSTKPQDSAPGTIRYGMTSSRTIHRCWIARLSSAIVILRSGRFLCTGAILASRTVAIWCTHQTVRNRQTRRYRCGSMPLSWQPMS